jgi:radical SAM protein with 4Fe4S-binding SPASM domain
MCYQTDFSAKSNMPAVIYADKLKEAYPHVRFVKLQGGEPTIMKNCREAAKLLRAYGHVKLQVTTNGVRVDDFWHETFVDQAEWVSFSVNAASREVYERLVRYGDFDRVLRNVERLTTARRHPFPRVGVTAVILKENLSQLHGIVELASRVGADYVEFLIDPILSLAGLPSRGVVAEAVRQCREAAIGVRMPVEGLETFQRALEPKREYRLVGSEARRMCPVPFRNLVVDPDGTVRVCCNTWVKLGNLHTSSVAEVWQSQRARRFRAMIRRDNYLWCSPTCSDNPCPSRLSLAHKYWSEFNEDPLVCLRKLEHKCRQLACRRQVSQTTRATPAT